MLQSHHGCIMLPSDRTAVTPYDFLDIVPITSHFQTMITQTTTPYHLLLSPSKVALRDEFLEKPVDVIRTPAFVIDRDVFAQNCTQMHRRASEWGASFRAHLKTHKVC